MRTAIIVAHPDDEVIWAGGLILQHPDWDWTVLSLCRADDADRAPKFERVCRHLGATGLISDLDDSDPLGPIDTEAEVAGRITKLLPATRWDLCLTHGDNGEYGHGRHKQVHAEVVRLVLRGTIACDELWTFAYECEPPQGACRPASWAEVLVDLTAEQLIEKKRIVAELYGYGRDAFEVTACISPESYTRRHRTGSR
jgi:LmbE family N-acetylglucosaminyl deacetylase